jgi:hypothetical protein
LKIIICYCYEDDLLSLSIHYVYIRYASVFYTYYIGYVIENRNEKYGAWREWAHSHCTGGEGGGEEEPRSDASSKVSLRLQMIKDGRRGTADVCFESGNIEDGAADLCFEIGNIEAVAADVYSQTAKRRSPDPLFFVQGHPKRRDLRLL